MDYEQKYKEVLKAADNLHRFSSDPKEIKVMEELFPELKESEDERIRKEIISFLDLYLGTITVQSFSIEAINKWIAWLENQKPIDNKILTSRELKDCIRKASANIDDALKSGVPKDQREYLAHAAFNLDKAKDIISEINNE